jgi:hypothetical protein
VNKLGLIELTIMNKITVKNIFWQYAIFLDPTTGDATDWTYANLGVVHSYSIELRPTVFQDERGFIVPPEQIVDSGSEILNGMIELVRNLDDWESLVSKQYVLRNELWTRYGRFL